LDQELKRFILYKGKPMDEVFEVIKKADVVEAVETVEALETVETVGTVEAVESLETFEEVETEEAIETLEAVGMVETDEEAGTIEAAETPEAVEEAEALEAPEIPAAPEAPAKPPTDDAETMGYFYEDAVVILPAIEELYTRIDTATEEDLENFVINAHGIKSALTYIGKKKASELAYELELAGKERNKAKIKEKTPYLMKTLRSIMESITETTDSE
jgi:HPt (histidine-containing phosphotransfer) domain-containing protein